MTAPECAGCPFPDQVAALELVRLREGIGRLAESYAASARSDMTECRAEAERPDADRESVSYWMGRSDSEFDIAADLRALLDDNQGDS